MDETAIGILVLCFVVVGIVGVFCLQATAPIYEKTICVKDIYQRSYATSPSITTMGGELYYVPKPSVWSQFVKGKSHTIRYNNNAGGGTIVDIVGKIGEYPCEPAPPLPTPYLSKT